MDKLKEFRDLLENLEDDYMEKAHKFMMEGFPEGVVHEQVRAEVCLKVRHIFCDMFPQVGHIYQNE